MKLLIISHTPHYLVDGCYVGWEPTIREINHLSKLFEQVVHVAPLYVSEAPTTVLPYNSPHITLAPVPVAGGNQIRDKVEILTSIPTYISTIKQYLQIVDVVHVRCPANISLIATLLLAISRRPKQRWIKYAGNWKPRQPEAWSYTIQRWCLQKNIARAEVTVNGEWKEQPEHVHSFFNPCLTDEELIHARQAVKDKTLTQPMRLILVGRLETAKGVGRVLQIVAALQASSTPVLLDLVGDGPERAIFEQQAAELGIRALVHFHGWLSRARLELLYSQAHIMLLPSDSEGWPKVISEAMSYGVVPLAGAVSCIPGYLEMFGTGKAIDPLDINGYVKSIREYFFSADKWKTESRKSISAAVKFTYSAYLESVKNLLNLSTS